MDFSLLLSGWSVWMRAMASSAVVFALVYVSLSVFKSVALRRLRKLASMTSNKADDTLVEAAEEVRWPMLFFLSLYVALQFAAVPAFFEKTILYAFIVVVTYYSVKFAQKFVDYFSWQIIEKRSKEESLADVSIISTITKFIKVSLWVIAGLLILDNLGYDITTLLAGVGVGGIAIAFALRSVLDDIFSSLSIYFDKPFVVGDFIIVGDDLGVVKKIGMKTTRIQHLNGQELIIPNKELTSSRINNYRKMEKRRVSFKFGVKYETPVEKIKKIPNMVKAVITGVELTEFDRAHFREFGDFSLNFEVVYYLNSVDYNKYMDVQQAINLGIMEAFNREGIEFAYPTQTVYVSGS